MEARRLGVLEVSAIGFGCMGMSEFYGPADEAEAIATIHRALDVGVTLLDTADMYEDVPAARGERRRGGGRALRPRNDAALGMNQKPRFAGAMYSCVGATSSGREDARRSSVP